MNHFIKQCRNGLVGYGIWLNMADSQIAEMATAAGFDWVCLDLQHGLAEMGDLAQLLPILEKGSACKIVRVLNDQPDQIGRVLDFGADGVIVPMIDTSEQAAKAAAACRYPPAGIRSCGPTRAMVHDPAYLQEANARIACIVMIETAAGLEHVEEIAATAGVDALFVGPADLSYALTGGIAGLRSPELEVALIRVIAAGANADKPVGIFCMGTENAKQRVERGFSFVSVNTDTALFASAIKSARTAAMNRS